MPPKVTVCVPTRDRVRYLVEAINSVMNQTFDDFELLVCDNASTDSTVETVRELRDPRIRLVRHPSNIGMAANWRYAVREASGIYCGVLADDDRWDPTFLERLLGPLEHDPGVDVAFSDHWIMDANGQVRLEDSEECNRRFRGGLRPGLHRPFTALALRQQAILPTAALFRRERVMATGALDIDTHLLSAYYLFGRLAIAGGGAYYVSGRLAYYRAHPLSASETASVEAWRALQRACDRLSREAPTDEIRAWIRQSWVEGLMGEGVLLLRQRERRGAMRAYATAARLAPLRPGPWIRLIVSCLGIYHWFCRLRTVTGLLVGRVRSLAIGAPPASS